MASVERGDTAPIVEALQEEKKEERRAHEVAAFAISTQGLSALTARLRGASALPGSLSEFLIAEISFSGARAQRLLETLVAVVGVLRAAGVEVVALKGAVLAFFHYPDPALRPMGDLDLLLQRPDDLARATAALEGAGWKALLDTPRHRVFARAGERVVRPAAEDPDNPIRIEIHTTFGYRVLGRLYDASPELRARALTRALGGTDVALASGPAFLRHLLFHATADFAGIGIRGIQAHDFRLLAREHGPLAPELPEIRSRGRTAPGAAPLLYAADAVERLFPRTFEEVFLSSLSSRVDPKLRARAAALPFLRYTHPARGWTRMLVPLVDGPIPRIRFLLRTFFPTPGEVKANAAPDASGVALARAYVRVLSRRIRSAFGR